MSLIKKLDISLKQDEICDTEYLNEQKNIENNVIDM